MSKDKSRDECLFERIKSIITGGVKIPRDVLLGEAYQ